MDTPPLLGNGNHSSCSYVAGGLASSAGFCTEVSVVVLLPGEAVTSGNVCSNPDCILLNRERGACGLALLSLLKRDGCAQGIVMLLQNRYQRRRMYTRIALGKSRAMDVVSGETSGSAGQLLILYPLLVGLQALQCWIGQPCHYDEYGFSAVACTCLGKSTPSAARIIATRKRAASFGN